MSAEIAQHRRQEHASAAQRGSALAALFVSGLAACTIHAPLQPLPETTSAALAFERSAAGMATDEWPTRQWWTSFGDEQLSSLVAEGLAANPDMDAALARLQAAQARTTRAHSPLVPSLDANLNAQRSRLSANGLFPPPIGGSTIWQNKASLDFSWEFDFWGRQRSALTAALREEQTAALQKDIAELSLSSAIARRYIEWQRLEEQLDIGRALTEQRAGLLSLTQKRVKAGLDSGVQLRGAEAAIPDARADVVALESQVAVTRIELAALLGAGPDRGLTLQRPDIKAMGPSGTPTLIPADLLARRPDVTARRLQAQAAAALADVAKADLYPNINLAVAVGLDSTSFEDWIDAGSRFYNAGPAVHLPIFGGGKHRAELKLRTAQYDEAAAEYRQALVGAVRDVAAALTEIRSVDVEQGDARAAVEAQTQAFNIARRRFEGGLGTYTDVLIAEAQLLNQRRRVVDLHARRLDASVRLTVALGGGIPTPAQTADAQH